MDVSKSEDEHQPLVLINPEIVERDAKGFIRTDFGNGRPALQTSRDGVFAIGDVRAGSTKRVAAAVGE